MWEPQLTYEMLVSLSKAFRDLRNASTPPKAVIITGEEPMESTLALV